MSFRKRKKFTKICLICNKTFLCADVKGKYCGSCKTKSPFCLCGCGKRVKDFRSKYVQGHGNKGKTYKEIYGSNNIKIGFQRGERNIAKQESIRKKISESVKASYDGRLLSLRREDAKKRLLGRVFGGRLKTKNKAGKLFRSRLEANFADFLDSKRIRYEYERPVKLYDGSLKIVDFVIDNVFIEISGYAYKSWREDFNRKIKKLRKTIIFPIIILTYKKYLELAWENNANRDIYLKAIDNKSEILKLLEYCKKLNQCNSLLEKYEV